MIVMVHTLWVTIIFLLLDVYILEIPSYQVSSYCLVQTVIIAYFAFPLIIGPWH